MIMYDLKLNQTKTNQVSFDIEILIRCIFDEFSGKYDHSKIENFIIRMPDMFTLLIKDREYILDAKS